MKIHRIPIDYLQNFNEDKLNDTLTNLKEDSEKLQINLNFSLLLINKQVLQKFYETIIQLFIIATKKILLRKRRNK